MTYKLSQFGFTLEEQDLLSKRLHPQVNKIFINNIAKKNNLTPTDIEAIDYSENEIFKQAQWSLRREQNAKRNIELEDDKVGAGKFKCLAHAKMTDKISHHKLLEDDYNRRGKQESKKDILKAIGRTPDNTPTDSEDELFRISEEEDEKKA